MLPSLFTHDNNRKKMAKTEHNRNAICMFFLSLSVCFHSISIGRKGEQIISYADDARSFQFGKKKKERM